MKPNFLDCPPRYTRARRDDTSSVDYACAVSRQPRRLMDWQDKVVVIACAVAIIAVAFIVGYWK